MNKIYFGKFDSKRPVQIQERYYAAGSKGNGWYGGIEPGDYVFVVSNAQVSALWRVREYGQKSNPINPLDSGVVFFDEIQKFPQPIPVSQFIKSPYFHVDLNLLNKISKATQGCGFFPIQTTPAFPFEQWEQLSFVSVRRFFITLSTQLPPLTESDVMVVIDNLENALIMEILEWQNGKMVPYELLGKLYQEKNPLNQRYSLRELLEYAEIEAPYKRNYLTSVLNELEKRGYFTVDNPGKLYDNVLVGRRKTPISKTIDGANPNHGVPEDDDEDLAENTFPEYYEEYRTYAELLDFNPNLILYGPPGTGKTYATKNIIEAFEYKRYKRYIPFSEVEGEDRVRFITFHQSYSYEEFIEGIRPQLIEDDAERNNGGGDIRYQVEPGVLKQMVEAASTQMLKTETQLSGISGTDLIRSNSKVWKVSLGSRWKDDEIYKRCKLENNIAVGWLDQYDLTDKSYDEIYSILEKERDEDAKKPTMDANTLDTLINRMSKGDIVFIYDGPFTIRDIGVITGDYFYKKSNPFPHLRQVTWIKEFTDSMDISEMNGGIRLTLKTIYELPRIQMSDVQKLVGWGNEISIPKRKAQTVESKPYYLIIDEINRGNISKIFGELMTLVEKDKRQTTSTILPYSKKPFTLPPNLYLIGTMNTADRSIAMLDTALRRRFVFVEVEPDYTVFANNTAKIGAVELAPLLRALNEKISEKLDRDHRIGHAYLMDALTLDDLYKAWYYKVLPLVAEYFYNDVTSIQSVVRRKFFENTGSLRFLDTASLGEGPSEFEKALIEIYKGSEV